LSREEDINIFTFTYPSVLFKQAFGTTETGNFKTETKQGTVWFKPGVYGLDYKVENNKLQLRDYHSDAKWILTDDYVDIADDGFIKILGRNSQLINVGGRKVFPSKVENVLLKHESIIDVKVYGVDNRILGNVVAADCVFYNEKLSRKEIYKFCKPFLFDSEIPIVINAVKRIELSARFKRI